MSGRTPYNLSSLFFETVGKAFRETGQAVDRVGIRLQKAHDLNSCQFNRNLSRHRTIQPMFVGGKPSVSSNVFIAPNSSVIGNVRVKENASIWYGAVVRADVVKRGEGIDLDDPKNSNLVEIGVGTNIQDNAYVYSNNLSGPCVLGANVTVGHNAHIISATVGDNCLIGMRSVLNPGVVVEGGAFVAAGAVVAPGTLVKEGELWVGSPARCLKGLTDKQKKQLVFQGEEYVKLGKRHIVSLDSLRLVGGEEKEEEEEEEEELEIKFIKLPK